VDNLNNVVCKASRHLRNKKREYLSSKVNEPEIDNKNKNVETCICASITKEGYQLCTVAKHEKGNLVAESHSILVETFLSPTACT